MTYVRIATQHAWHRRDGHSSTSGDILHGGGAPGRLARAAHRPSISRQTLPLRRSRSQYQILASERGYPVKQSLSFTNVVETIPSKDRPMASRADLTSWSTTAPRTRWAPRCMPLTKRHPREVSAAASIVVVTRSLNRRQRAPP